MNDIPRVSASTPAAPFVIEDPRERSIFERISKLVGPGPAAFFRDACRLMREPERYATSTHLVAHLLREIESGLRDVLASLTADAEESKEKLEKYERVVTAALLDAELPLKDRLSKKLLRLTREGQTSHREDVEAILKALEIPLDDNVAKLWLKLVRGVGKRGKGKLHKRAHRRRLSTPNPFNEDFGRFWNDTCTVLNVVLERFEARYGPVYSVFDSLLDVEDPTNEHVSTLLGQLPHSFVGRKYFFGKLLHPRWLVPLRRRQVFVSPPLETFGPSGERIKNPAWPEGDYLVRMSKIDSVQETVASILGEMDSTSNRRAQEQLAEALLNLPDHLAERLLPRVAEWATWPLEYRQPGHLLRLAVRAGELGKRDLGLQIARDVLSPDAQRTALNGEPGTTLADPDGEFGAWKYREVFEKLLEPLVCSLGRGFVLLLSDILEEACQIPRFGDTPLPRSNSNWWRQSVGAPSQSPTSGVDDAVLDGLRDAAVMYIGDNPGDLTNIVEDLEGREWEIHKRVALHLLSRFPKPGSRLIESRLVDPSLFRDSRVAVEFHEMVSSGFLAVPGEARARYLDLILKEPNLSWFWERSLAREGVGPSRQRIAARAEKWRRDRLAPIHRALSPAWQAYYQELVVRNGEPDPLGYSGYFTDFVGPTSPLSKEDLASMGIDDLIDYLKAWTVTSDDPIGPSMDGLGRELSELVKDGPDPYADAAMRFRVCDPTYVRHLLHGLDQARRADKTFEWFPVLDLCLWVLDQPREIPGRSTRLYEQDADWREARRAIGHLLRSGLVTGDGRVPFDLRQEVWKAIEGLATDPEPATYDERERGDGSFDAATMALNSIRGVALMAAVQYGLWTKVGVWDKGNGPALEDIGLAEMPELRKVLEDHLDSEQDPSLAIRSVYGQGFPWLTWIDPMWARSKLAAVFPTQEGEEAYRTAAWHAFILYGRDFNLAYEVLEPEYLAQARALGQLERKEGDSPPVEACRLGEHVMQLLWLGDLAGGVNDELVSSFFGNAPGDVRAHALRFVGLRLLDSEHYQPETHKGIATDLWRSRLEADQGDEDARNTELAAFGWWARTPHLSDEWVLDQLEALADLGVEIDDSRMVIERLANTAPSAPLRTMRCLKRMMPVDGDGFEPLHWRDEAKKVMRITLDSGDAEAARMATETINRLVANGWLDYRELLAPSEGDDDPKTKE